MKRTHLLSLAALLVATTATGLWAVFAADAAKPSGKEVQPPAEPSKLVVHEWGTFTSFSGSDGKNLSFPHKSGDLPGFVYHNVGQWSKARWDWNLFNPISLETPVLYFYTEQKQTVSVQVDFPKGFMTEWYPKVDNDQIGAPRQLIWKKVNLLPGATLGTRDLDKRRQKDEAAPARGTVLLPVQEPRDSHYYPARETDAVPLQVGQEQEKLLFYRGVADFAPPVSVQAVNADDFRVKNNHKETVTGAVLVRSIDKSHVRCTHLDDLKGGTEITVSLPCKSICSTDELAEKLVKSLMNAGLFEKEARAMVKTWRADWFNDPGTRLLYIAPRPYAGELLPLKIEPKPAATVRVLVGRHDIITSEQERQLDASVKKLQVLNAEIQALSARSRAIQSTLDKEFGRFELPARQAAEVRLKKQN
jgi:hypothetical protein